MTLRIETIHHVGLVVKDREDAQRFYVDLLGLQRVPGRPAWLKLNATNAIHLIPLGTGEPEHPHHRYRHVAFQVADLRPVLDRLLGHGVRVFQADFQGNERTIATKDDPLDFGTGSCSYSTRMATDRVPSTRPWHLRRRVGLGRAGLTDR
jgi:catechol 2,3-dioxygenase-like lactoylglutathione lyase family enzyme